MFHISQMHNSRDFQLNWKLIFYIIVIASLIIAGFFILKSRNKSIITQYDQEIYQMKNALEENYRQRLVKSEKSASDLIITGVELIKINKIKLAVIALEEAVKRDKKIRDVHIYAGYAYLQLSSQINKQENKETKEQYLEEAKQYLKKAKVIDPIHSLTYKYLANVYFELGDADKANLCYNKAKSFEIE